MILPIPPCPTPHIGQADNTGAWLVWSDDRPNHGEPTCCPDCNGSGHHPDIIERLATLLWNIYEIEPDAARNDAVAVLDAFTGDTG